MTHVWFRYRITLCRNICAASDGYGGTLRCVHRMHARNNLLLLQYHKNSQCLELRKKKAEK